MSRRPLAVATALLMVLETIGAILLLIPLAITMIAWTLPLMFAAIFLILAPVEIVMVLYIVVWLAVFLVSVLTRGDARYSKRLTARRKRFTSSLHIEDRLDKGFDVATWPMGIVIEHALEPLTDDIERRYKWLNGK